MFLDTSGLLCYIDGRDARHHDAVTLFHSASTRLTHSYVLAEFIPLCMTRNMPRQTTLEFAARLLDPAAGAVMGQGTTRMTISTAQPGSLSPAAPAGRRGRPARRRP